MSTGEEERGKGRGRGVVPSLSTWSRISSSRRRSARVSSACSARAAVWATTRLSRSAVKYRLSSATSSVCLLSAAASAAWNAPATGKGKVCFFIVVFCFFVFVFLGGYCCHRSMGQVRVGVARTLTVLRSSRASRLSRTCFTSAACL